MNLVLKKLVVTNRVAVFNFKIMKKITSKTDYTVCLNDIYNPCDAYVAIAQAKANHYLSNAQRYILYLNDIDKYFKSFYTFCGDIECDKCIEAPTEGTIKLIIKTKKENVFKRLWNKLFKRSSK